MLRADLDQTATSYDKIVVAQSGGFGASIAPGPPLKSNSPAPADSKTTYSIVNYSGNFGGTTNNITWNGTPLVNPTNLVFTSSNPNVVGRNTQLSVNDTEPHVGYHLSARRCGGRFNLDRRHGSYQRRVGHQYHGQLEQSGDRAPILISSSFATR